MNWFLLFLKTFALCFFLCFVVVFIFKVEKTKLKRLGGAVFLVSFLVSFFISDFLVFSLQIKGLIGSLFLILVFGVLDDIFSFSWKKQLLFQFFLFLILVFTGFQIDYLSGFNNEMFRLDSFIFNIGIFKISLFSTFFIFVYLFLIINAVNWADGSDGVASLLGLLASLSIFFISLKRDVNQPAVAIMAMNFIAVLLAFWWWNFPPAKVEAGTSGSYSIGFVLVALSIISGTKVATVMMILALYVFDAFWVIMERIRDGKSPMERDEFCRHLHYKLRFLGWSDKKIVLFYVLILSLFLMLVVFVEDRNFKIIILFLEFISIACFVYFLGKKISNKIK